MKFWCTSVVISNINASFLELNWFNFRKYLHLYIKEKLNKKTWI